MADCSDGFMNIHISLSSSNYPVKLYTLNMSSVSYISCTSIKLFEEPRCNHCETWVNSTGDVSILHFPSSYDFIIISKLKA